MRSILPLPLMVFGLACSGASSPPPPVPTPTPGSVAADGSQPLSSRQAGAPAGPAMPGSTSATLPPGHPPIEGGPTPAPPLPAGHPPIGGAAPGAVTSAGSIAGTIKLAPSLKAGPADILYVMAKSGANTLAVKRIEKPSFPLAFEIGGADAMMSGQAFEGPVDVVARLSRTGDAIPSKGDAEGTTRAVRIPSKDVSVTIDSVRQ